MSEIASQCLAATAVWATTVDKMSRAESPAGEGAVVLALSALQIRSTLLRPRLVVMTGDGADVVAAAGGLLFDLATGGWDVTALISRADEERALRVLGVSTLNLEAALSIKAHKPGPRAVLVCPGLYNSDQRVRLRMQSRLGADEVNFLWWDQLINLGPDVPRYPVQHTLSVAAHAFKAQAMASLGVTTVTPGDPESFYCTRPDTGQTLLVAAGDV